jgi:dihydroceramidase
MYEKEIANCGIPEHYIVALFTLVGIGFATFHGIYQNALVFQLFFGILAWLCLLRLVGHYASVKDPRARAVARSSMRTVIFGFGLWLLDYHYCGAMQSLPMNPQGHAWWHLLMGVGTYHGPVFMQYVRAEQMKKHAEIVSTGFGLHTIIIHESVKKEELKKEM